MQRNMHLHIKNYTDCYVCLLCVALPLHLHYNIGLWHENILPDTENRLGATGTHVHICTNVNTKLHKGMTDRHAQTQHSPSPCLSLYLSLSMLLNLRETDIFFICQYGWKQTCSKHTTMASLAQRSLYVLYA